jgi:hypothetical protein
MGSGPQAPTPPDPMQTARAQGTMNRETAITQYGLNATNQQTPYGNLSYEQTGSWADGTPRYTSSTTLNPEQQGLLDQQNQFGRLSNQLGIDQVGRLSGVLSQPINMSGVGPRPELGASQAQRTAPQNLQEVEGRLIELGNRRLDPMLQQRRQQLETQLINQGVGRGTEAWQNGMQELGRDENDARNQLLLTGNQQSFDQGMSTANQQFGQGMSLDQNALARYNAQLGGRGQGLQEAMALRNQPINEITALMSGGQVSQPNFTNTPQSNVAPVDYMGAVNNNYNAQNQQYQAQMQRQGALYGALGGMGGSLMGGWARGGFANPFG